MNQSFPCRGIVGIPYDGNNPPRESFALFAIFLYAAMPKTPSHEPLPPGKTMLYWLSRACKAARERTDKKPREAHKAIGVSLSSMYRFEEGTTWPRYVDQVVAGYARLTGISDARELWALALRLWFEYGQPPRDHNGGMSEEISAIVRQEIEQLTKT